MSIDPIKTWPKPQPKLESERLILRPYTLDDAPALQCLIGDFAVADTTLSIPHPYPDGGAEEYISSLAARYEKDSDAIFAITLKADRTFIGAIGLHGANCHRRAELGYWIGKPYWNRGFASEAGQTVTEFGFTVLGLHKITSGYFARNPASGRVQEKIGFLREGYLREHLVRWNRFEDLVVTAKFPPN